LHELKAGMIKYPQRMINVPLSRKVDVGNLPTVQAAVVVVEQQLAKQGRVLLRASGTEPLL
jgi:phosphoglucosamine mutase